MTPGPPDDPNAPGLFSGVVLLCDEERWPAGTSGIVMETFPQVALVEISDDEDIDVERVVVPYDRLMRRPSTAQARLVDLNA